MRKLIVGAAATLLVAALVMASEPTVSRTPSEMAINQATRSVPGVPAPQIPQNLVSQFQSQGEPRDTQGGLGWAVDVWKDSNGQGVALGLDGGARQLGGEDLLAAIDIRNEVFRLLDRQIKLRPGETWESERLDTSRFTGIGLKVAGEGGATCRTFWRWTADETFLAEGPEVLVASREAPRTGFGDVLGMEVRIGCEGSSTGPSAITDLKLMFRR